MVQNVSNTYRFVLADRKRARSRDGVKSIEGLLNVNYYN
jgi:hypothetical protein